MNEREIHDLMAEELIADCEMLEGEFMDDDSFAAIRIREIADLRFPNDPATAEIYFAILDSFLFDDE